MEIIRNIENINYSTFNEPITRKKNWFDFSRVSCEDLNAVLAIIQIVTNKPVAPIEKEDFEEKSKQFLSLRGVVEQPIAKGVILEWRKTKYLDESFIRLKLRGGKHIEEAQEKIDEYFVSKKNAYSYYQIS